MRFNCFGKNNYKTVILLFAVTNLLKNKRKDK